jgi:hypothetical protein
MGNRTPNNPQGQGQEGGRQNPQGGDDYRQGRNQQGEIPQDDWDQEGQRQQGDNQGEDQQGQLR